MLEMWYENLDVRKKQIMNDTREYLIIQLIKLSLTSLEIWPGRGGWILTGQQTRCQCKIKIKLIL